MSTKTKVESYDGTDTTLELESLPKEDRVFLSVEREDRDMGNSQLGFSINKESAIILRNALDDFLNNCK